jgi:hypothetical protein
MSATSHERLDVCSERLSGKAVYVKPHGGVEDL